MHACTKARFNMIQNIVKYYGDPTNLHALDEIYTKYTSIDAKGAGNPMGLWAPHLLHGDFLLFRGCKGLQQR